MPRPKKTDAPKAVAPKKGAKAVVPEIVEEKAKPARGAKFDLSTVEGVLASQSGLLYRGRATPNLKPEALPFGLYDLDRNVTHIGGGPRGRIIEIVGNEASGKSTLCLKLIAMAQAAGHECAYIDAEHALDGDWAALQGVDMDALVVGKPEWGEQALDLVQALLMTFKITLIVVDSVAALVPKKELEGDMGDSIMGVHAKLMSQALRKLTALVEKSNALLVFTNQYRSTMSSFGPGKTTTGGNALKFYAALRLETTNVGKIKEGGSDAEDALVIGNEIRITALKNKMGPPWRVAKIPLLHTTGYDNAGSLFELCVKNGLECIVQEGVMWVVFGVRCRGRAAAVAASRAYEKEMVRALDNFYTSGLVGWTPST